MNAGFSTQFPPPCTFSQVLNELLTSLIYLSGTYREHNVHEAQQTALGKRIVTTCESFLNRSVFQTLPCEHARGAICTEKRWQKQESMKKHNT